MQKPLDLCRIYIYKPEFIYAVVPQYIIEHEEFTKCISIMMSRTRLSLWDAI
jgi:hypothetical protein